MSQVETTVAEGAVSAASKMEDNSAPPPTAEQTAPPASTASEGDPRCSVAEEDSSGAILQSEAPSSEPADPGSKASSSPATDAELSSQEQGSNKSSDIQPCDSVVEQAEKQAAPTENTNSESDIPMNDVTKNTEPQEEHAEEIAASPEESAQSPVPENGSNIEAVVQCKQEEGNVTMEYERPEDKLATPATPAPPASDTSAGQASAQPESGDPNSPDAPQAEGLEKNVSQKVVCDVNSNPSDVVTAEHSGGKLEELKEKSTEDKLLASDTPDNGSNDNAIDTSKVKPEKKEKEYPDMTTTDDLTAWLSGINKDLASFVQKRAEEKKEADKKEEDKISQQEKVKEESVHSGNESEEASPKQTTEMPTYGVTVSTNASDTERVTYKEPAKEHEGGLPDVMDKDSFDAWMTKISSNIAKVGQASTEEPENTEAVAEQPTKAMSPPPGHSREYDTKWPEDIPFQAPGEQKEEAPKEASRTKLRDISNKSDMNARLSGISRDLEKLAQRANAEDENVTYSQSTNVNQQRKDDTPVGRSQINVESGIEVVTHADGKTPRPILKSSTSFDAGTLENVKVPMDKKAAHVHFSFKTNPGDTSHVENGVVVDEKDNGALQNEERIDAQPPEVDGGAAAAAVGEAAPLVEALREGEGSLEFILDSISEIEFEMGDAVGHVAKLSNKLQRLHKSLQKVKHSTQALVDQHNEDIDNYNELD